jgi:hypothetical protein
VTYSTNRAKREDDYPIDLVAPTGTRLTDGLELARVLFLSKTADLYVTGIQNVLNAWAGWGPRLDELDFTGDDSLPDLMTFVGTQIDTFAAAFRRQDYPFSRPDLVATWITGNLRQTQQCRSLVEHSQQQVSKKNNL